MAPEQIVALRMGYERRRTLPMRMSVTIAVRAANRSTLERRTKRLRQRFKDLGAEVRLASRSSAATPATPPAWASR